MYSFYYFFSLVLLSTVLSSVVSALSGVISNDRGGLVALMLYDFQLVFGSYFPYDSLLSSYQNGILSQSINQTCSNSTSIMVGNKPFNCTPSFMPLTYGPIILRVENLNTPMNISSLIGMLRFDLTTQYAEYNNYGFLMGGKKLNNGTNRWEYFDDIFIYLLSIPQWSNSEPGPALDWTYFGKMPFKGANLRASLAADILPQNTFHVFIHNAEIDYWCDQPICDSNIWYVEISPIQNTWTPMIPARSSVLPPSRCGAMSFTTNAFSLRPFNDEFHVCNFFYIGGQLSANETIHPYCKIQDKSIPKLDNQQMNIMNNSLSSVNVNVTSQSDNDLCCQCYGSIEYPVTYLTRTIEYYYDPEYIIFSVYSDTGWLTGDVDCGVMGKRSCLKENNTIGNEWNFTGRSYSRVVTADSLSAGFDNLFKNDVGHYFAGGQQIISDQTSFINTNICYPSLSLAILPISNVTFFSEMYTTFRYIAEDGTIEESEIRLCGSIPLPSSTYNQYPLHLFSQCQAIFTPRVAEDNWYQAIDLDLPSLPAYKHQISVLDLGNVRDCAGEEGNCFRFSSVMDNRYNVPITVTVSGDIYNRMILGDSSVLALSPWQCQNPIQDSDPIVFTTLPPSYSAMRILQPLFSIPLPYTLPTSTLPPAIRFAFETCISGTHDPHGSSFLCQGVQSNQINKNSTIQISSSESLLSSLSSELLIFWLRELYVCFIPGDYYELLGPGFSTDEDCDWHSNDNSPWRYFYVGGTCPFQCSTGYHWQPVHAQAESQTVWLTCAPDGTWIDHSSHGLSRCVRDELNCPHPTVSYGDEICILPSPVIYSIQGYSYTDPAGSFSYGCSSDIKRGRVFNCSVESGAIIVVRGEYFQHPLVVNIGPYVCEDPHVIDEENESKLCPNYTNIYNQSNSTGQMCLDLPVCFRYSDGLSCLLKGGEGYHHSLTVIANGQISLPFVDALSFAQPKILGMCSPHCTTNLTYFSFLQNQTMNESAICPILQARTSVLADLHFYNQSWLLCPSHENVLSSPQTSPTPLYTRLSFYVSGVAPAYTLETVVAPFIRVGDKECTDAYAIPIHGALAPFSESISFYYVSCTLHLSKYYGESSFLISLTTNAGMGASNQDQIVNHEFSISFTKCPPGSVYSSGVTTTDQIVSCLPCRAGTAFQKPDADGVAACLLCAPGYFASNVGQVVCDQCPPGHISSNSSGSTYCTTCPAGSAPNNDASDCIVCKPGYYSPVNESLTCLPCPHNTYTSAEGSVTCSLCPPNSWQPGGNDEEGKSSCQVCEGNTYLYYTNQSSNSAKCIDCPSGMTCRASGDIVADEGYWIYVDQESAEPISFSCSSPAACRSGFVCIRNLNIRSNSIIIATSNLSAISCCSENRIASSDNVLCGRCIDGYSEWNGVCTDCSNSGYGYVIGGSFIIFILVCVLRQVASYSSTRVLLNGEESSSLSIVVYYTQMSTHFFSGETTLSVLGLFSLQLDNTIPVSACLISITPIQHIMMRLLLPIVAIISLIVIYIIELVIRKLMSDRFSNNISRLPSLSNYIRTLVTLLLFSYNTIAISTLAYFNCRQIGVYTVLSDYPAIYCYDSEYWSRFPLFLLLLIVIVIGWPIALALFLYHKKEQINRCLAICNENHINQREISHNYHSEPRTSLSGNLSPLSTPFLENVHSTNSIELDNIERKDETTMRNSNRNSSKDDKLNYNLSDDYSFISKYSTLFVPYTAGSSRYYQSYILSRRVTLISLTTLLFTDSAQSFAWGSIGNLLFLIIHFIQLPYVDPMENKMEIISLSMLTLQTMLLTVYPVPFNSVKQAVLLFLIVLLPIPIMIGMKELRRWRRQVIN